MGFACGHTDSVRGEASVEIWSFGYKVQHFIFLTEVEIRCNFENASCFSKASFNIVFSF